MEALVRAEFGDQSASVNRMHDVADLASISIAHIQKVTLAAATMRCGEVTFRAFERCHVAPVQHGDHFRGVIDPANDNSIVGKFKHYARSMPRISQYATNSPLFTVLRFAPVAVTVKSMVSAAEYVVVFAPYFS